MDLSKLQRLSETNKDQPPPIAADPSQPSSTNQTPANYPQRVLVPVAAEPIGTVGDAWISLAVGVIILLLSPRLLQYLLSRKSFDANYTFSDANGPLAYTQTIFFWGDLCLYLFAFSLIAEGLILAFARKPLPIAVGFGLTCLATAANAIYLVVMVSQNYGFQLFSALAVAFGVYIAMYQWNLLKAFAAARSPQ